MARVGIIGGGIIGTFTAWYLSESGHQVTILDKGDMKSGTSYGNAGMVVPSHMVPLASPGVVAKGLRWLLSASSPLYIKPTLDLRSLSWLWSFYRSANTANVSKNASHLAALSQLSRQLYLDLEQSGDISVEMQKNGIVMLYHSEKTGEEEGELVELAHQFNIPAEKLSPDQLAALDSSTKYTVAGGILFPEDLTLNPGQLMVQMQEKLMAKGVTFCSNTDISGFKYGQLIEVTTRNEVLEFDKMVVTAGVWTRDLIREWLGVKVPLMAGKGYSFDVPNSIGLELASLLLDHRVSVTPLGDRIRFGGTMELARVNGEVHMKRVKAIVEAIPLYYPDLEVNTPSESSVWMGYRPCSTDGMPIIGEIPNFPNMALATGHGMLGVSLAPVTGALIADWVNSEEYRVDTSRCQLIRP